MNGPILLTGGSGRLAQAIQRQRPDAVHAVARQYLDIASAGDVARWFDTIRPSLVINAAAFTHVDAAESRQDEAERANIAGPATLAAAAAERGVALIHISTDYVFGDGDCLWREDDPPAPINLYGRSKAEGEAAVLKAGGRALIARVAWLFDFADDFIHRMLRQGAQMESVRVAADQVGSPTPVNEAAARLLILADQLRDPARDLPSIVHLAGSPPVSRADWITLAFETATQAGAPLGTLQRVPADSFQSPARRPRHSALDTCYADSLFGSALDWRAPTVRIARAWAKRQG